MGGQMKIGTYTCKPWAPPVVVCRVVYPVQLFLYFNVHYYYIINLIATQIIKD